MQSFRSSQLTLGRDYIDNFSAGLALRFLLPKVPKARCKCCPFTSETQVEKLRGKNSKNALSPPDILHLK